MKEFTIIRGPFDNRKRKLIIDSSFVTFETSDLKSNLYTTFKKEEIAGVKFGYSMINGLHIYIGREYKVCLLNKENKELIISFKLFYGRKLQEKHQLFSEIVDEIWDVFCKDLIQSFIEQFNNGIEFTVANVAIHQDSISFKNIVIYFDDLEIKSYQHYFMLQSKADPYKNIMLYFLIDYNCVLLRSVLNYILEERESQNI